MKDLAEEKGEVGGYLEGGWVGGGGLGGRGRRALLATKRFIGSSGGAVPTPRAVCLAHTHLHTDQQIGVHTHTHTLL